MAKTKKSAHIFLFFGPPGSGKGTQSDLLGEKLHLPVISPGELLRHEIEKGSPVGRQAEAKMAQGKLLADKIVEGIISQRIKRRDCGSGFILDGFPRRFGQLRWLTGEVKARYGEQISLWAFYVRVSDAEALRRIGGRRVCDCGAAYHLKTNPPKRKGVCDLCGRKLEIRADDRPAVMKDRLKTYHESARPILEYFRKQHELISVDGKIEIDRLAGIIWAEAEKRKREY